MAARCDPDSNRMLSEIACEAYTEALIADLGSRFGFDGKDRGNVERIRRIAQRYVWGCRVDWRDPDRKKERDDYKKLLAATLKFEAAIREYGRSDLDYDMYRAAYHILKEPPPQTDFPTLTDHQKKRGEPYYFELRRLLNILKIGVGETIDHETMAPGPQSHLGMQNLVTDAADFWIEVVHGRFSLDYHKGVAWTATAEFVKALVEPLDDVTDSQIVTAMKAEIKERRTHGIPTEFSG